MAFAKTALALGVAAVTVAACSGDIETRKLSPERMTDTEHWVAGVIIYQPALFVEISSKTTLVDSGKLKGSSADNPPACVPVQSEKTVALPDLKNPYQIRYSPGLFDSNTFGVMLQTGTLTSVNGNLAGALNGSGIGGGATAGSGGALAGLPSIPTPLGIPLSAPAPTAPSDEVMPIPVIRVEPAQRTPRVQRIQLRPTLPACNDGAVILGYRRLTLP
ncbi:MAG TPA: hypothetical protein VMQ11_08485 [Alphaproteobacteria bacterium]|nr:hypothetical protein [Alphaproteobacteria bacterium]